MKENFVLVFDIGSSTVRAMLAGKGINDTIKVKGYQEVDYEGFYEGKFLYKDRLPSLFEEIIKQFDVNDIDKIYIGVPSEFSSVIVVQESINLGNRRKIKKQDIDSLFYLAAEKSKNGEVEMVSVSPLSYSVDGFASIDPTTESGSLLSASLSIIYANREFIELFNDIAGELGFSTVDYISEPLAEAQYIVPKERRDELTLLVDGGDLTTSIALVKGDGLSALASVSRGGGFITNDLAEAFELSMGEADRLKKQIVLSLKGGANDFYEFKTDLGKMTKIPLNFANEVVSYRIEELADVIAKSLQLSSAQLERFLPIYLTGGGITRIKGARDYLAKCLGRNIAYGVPRLPGKEKPELASIYSLLFAALT